MSTLVVPPLYVSLLDDSRRRFYDEKAHAFEVFHFWLDGVTGLTNFMQVFCPAKRSEIVAIRTYAHGGGSAGSGSYEATVAWYDSAGGASVVGSVTSLTADTAMVEVLPTDNVLIDPYDPGCRLVAEISAFSGTAWTAVAVDVIAIPISR